MNLEPTEEQKAIIGVLHEFAESEIRSAARECEAAGCVSEGIEKGLAEMGVAAPVPEQFGGQGTFDALTSVMIAEEVAWGDPGVAFSVLGAGLAATLIDLAGTDGQRADLLPRFAAGARGGVALAERDAGADFTRLEAVASIAGGTARLSGTKYGVVNAEPGTIRLVVAGTGSSLGVWLIPETIELVARPEDKLGLRSASTFKVRFDGVQVPAAGRLGGRGHDPEAPTLALLRAKLLGAGIALGLGRAAIEYATVYARERTAFGRPIGAFQAVAFKIADRAVELETARLLAWKAAWAVDGRRPEATGLVVSACSQAVSAAVAAADDGVQILGGHGYMRDHPVELWYRDALTLATFDSPSMVSDIFLAGAYAAASSLGEVAG